MDQNTDKKELFKEALEAREQSYCPYSGFAVGAALLTKSGKIYRGANIENAGYSGTVCAERTAVFKAVGDGERGFAAVAVAGGKAGAPPESFCAPCGVCRQVLAEFCGGDLIVYFVKSEGEWEEHTLGELLPHSFGPEQLTNN